jgi:hypothetical protein
MAIKATYFSIDTTPIGFIALPPTNLNALDVPNPPILALRSYILWVIHTPSHAFPAKIDGAGVDIFKEHLWIEPQQRSWVILPSGRTPWACGFMPPIESAMK